MKGRVRAPPFHYGFPEDGLACGGTSLAGTKLAKGKAARSRQVYGDVGSRSGPQGREGKGAGARLRATLDLPVDSIFVPAQGSKKSPGDGYENGGYDRGPVVPVQLHPSKIRAHSGADAGSGHEHHQPGHPGGRTGKNVKSPSYGQADHAQDQAEAQPQKDAASEKKGEAEYVGFVQAAYICHTKIVTRSTACREGPDGPAKRFCSPLASCKTPPM